MNELSSGKTITVRAGAVLPDDLLSDGGRVEKLDRAEAGAIKLHIRYLGGDYGQVDTTIDAPLTVTRPRSQSADVAERLGAHARPPLAIGYSSQAVRLNAPSAALRWYMTLDSSERGAIVTAAWLEALPALERMRARADLGLK